MTSTAVRREKIRESRQNKGMRSNRDPKLTRQVEQLAQLEMDFIFNEEFVRASPESILEDSLLDVGEQVSNWKPSKDLPVHLVRMCERKLLSPAEERSYFRRMNYAKYRAELLRRKLDPNEPDADLADQVTQLLDLSLRDREEIVRGNLRLVISLAKKFSGGLVPFDELLSEGIETLLRAIEKFDYARGFRFSTYATQAVRRTLYRHLQTVQRDRSRFVGADESLFEDFPAGESNSPAAERRSQMLRAKLAEFIDNLNPRERTIIQVRFGLGEPDQIRTLQSLADEMGICKERVRQLEIRAINKLREMAESQNNEWPTSEPN